MKFVTFIFIFAVVFASGQLQAQVTSTTIPAGKISSNRECESLINAVSMTALGTLRTTSTVFNHNGGVFDPIPLLVTSIETKSSGCIIVHFSANSRPSDNSVVYQVRMDGKPLEGHITSGLASMGNITVPFVVEPDDASGAKPMRMGSFTFFGQAKPGRHKIEVLLAACCSANQGSGPGYMQVDNATLVVQYQGN